MSAPVVMRVDLRDHEGIREQVRAGIAALRVQGRQIWGDTRNTLPEIVVRLMVGVGDLARIAREGPAAVSESSGAVGVEYRNQVKKELGNLIFSTIRWIDDLGFDPVECLELAIDAQEKFAKSGRPR